MANFSLPLPSFAAGAFGSFCQQIAQVTFAVGDLFDHREDCLSIAEVQLEAIRIFVGQCPFSKHSIAQAMQLPAEMVSMPRSSHSRLACATS